MLLRSNWWASLACHGACATVFFTLLGPVATASSKPLAELAALTPNEWNIDLEALLQGLAQNDANFEDTIRIRRVDLAAVATRARNSLAVASTTEARQAAIEQIVRSLADPHVRIDWSPPSDTQPMTACPSELAARSMRQGIGFARLAAFTPLDTAAAKIFEAGVLKLSGHRRVGVIRIPFFLARAQPSACAHAAAEAQLQPDATCDDRCVDDLERRAGRWLGDRLVETVQGLQHAGATRLLVDVTHNDGGSDWSEVIARMLAGSLRSAPIAMLKHPSWAAYADARLAQLDAASDAAQGALRQHLKRAGERLAAARHELSEPCDLSGAWQDDDHHSLPTCSTLVTGGWYATGAFPRDEDAPDRIAPELFSPALYAPYPRRITRLPLTLLADGNSHSAAEQFVAVLKDNGRATLIGAVTAGAGCGSFTLQGSRFALPHSHAMVDVPDCVRLRADGTSERRGVEPDVLVPWGPSDSQYERAAKVAKVLNRLR